MNNTMEATDHLEVAKKRKKKIPTEVSIFLVLVGIAILFEILGWIVRGDSFLMNPQRLLIMILQMSIIGIIAIGVTQVIITGGIDLSSGSVLALTAMVTASFAQQSDYLRAVYPALTDLPWYYPYWPGS